MLHLRNVKFSNSKGETIDNIYVSKKPDRTVIDIEGVMIPVCLLSDFKIDAAAIFIECFDEIQNKAADIFYSVTDDVVFVPKEAAAFYGKPVLLIYVNQLNFGHLCYYILDKYEGKPKVQYNPKTKLLSVDTGGS